MKALTWAIALSMNDVSSAFWLDCSCAQVTFSTISLKLSRYCASSHTLKTGGVDGFGGEVLS
ncbi:MAG: hypothetical protein HYX38_30525 [Rhodospirillales bacterium]|nr:hypothetical protein [Rhodospirillales bacterium]